MALPGDETTTVNALLLGDHGCGKSTFLSYLKNGRRSTTTNTDPSLGRSVSILRDVEQPFIFDIRFTKKSFRLEVYDTAYPERHWSLLHPDVIIIAFDISNRNTLNGMKAVRSSIHSNLRSCFPSVSMYRVYSFFFFCMIIGPVSASAN